MKYVILYRRDEDLSCATDHAVDGEKWRGAIVDNDLPIDQAAHYYTKMLFYGGDPNATPIDYSEAMYNQWDRHEKPVELIILPANGMVSGDFHAIKEAHRRWHEEKQQTEQREADLAELARLKAIYETEAD